MIWNDDLLIIVLLLERMICMNFKPLEEWDDLDLLNYMEDHQKQIWKANGVYPETAHFAKLEADRYKILRDHYQKERDKKAAAALAELEEEAASGYVISFKSNVKGGSK